MAQDLLGQFGSALSGGVSSLEKGASSLASTVSNDAGQFVANAQNSVAQLTGSGVNSAGQIVGPLADAFGKNPMDFVLNATKHFSSFFRKVANRVADITGTAAYAAEPGAAVLGNKPIQVKAHVTSKDSDGKVALVLACACRDHPAQVLQAANDIRTGVTTSRGLYGPFVWYPTVGMGGEAARGFFGIDEAAAAAAALAILVAIAPALVTGLIALVGAVAPQVVSTISGVLAPKPPPPPDNKILGLDPPIVIGAAVLLIGAVAVLFLMKGKHHA